LVPTEEPLRCIKIKLFGSSGVGKTTLIGSLKCSYLGSFFRKTRLSSKSSATWKNRNSLMRTSMDKSSNSSMDESIMSRSVLDNFDVSNDHYTKGIDISNVTFINTSHFSIWEFSGYEPYQIFYDHFIGDHNCIHFMMYSLENSEYESLNELVYWLEFLKARLPPKEQFGHNGKYLSTLKILLIGTHADCDKTASKNEDGEYVSDKANSIYKHILNIYKDEFDICERHFVLDARGAWVPEIKSLMQYCNKLKESICNRLPKCTMFLSRSLHNVQNWRKLNPQYPIVSWKKFIEMIRERVNPLASDEHLKEIIQQLQLMGEVIYIQSDQNQDLVCLDPQWLCNSILGTFFSHERFNGKKLNGCFKLDELAAIFADICPDVKRLKDILVALDLCCELDNSEYEFPSLNFQETVSSLWENHNEGYIYNGLQIRCSNQIKTLIGCLFPRIQVHLRHVANSIDDEHDLKEENSAELILESQDKLGNLDMNKSSLIKNNQKSFIINTSNSLSKHFNSSLYDIELFQWRYGSKIQRKKSKIECLITMDPRGLFIELKARAPLSKREELFYFIHETHSLIEQILLETCPGLNLEMHYLSPNQCFSFISSHSYTPRQVYNSMLDGKMILISQNNNKEKLIDVICCESEQIYKNLIIGCNLPINEGIGLYTKRMLSRFLDNIDPMGRDWCLLAVLLGLQDHLPILDNENSLDLSKTQYLIDNWSKSRQTSTVRMLIEKLVELGRKDVVDLVMNTSVLFKILLNDDSGIRNSNQTLASTK
jgi:death-associated protein kinase